MSMNTNNLYVHENLDTAYVNLAALLRYLQARAFNGRVHVELDEYEADITLNAGTAPRVRETNHATGRTDEGEGALQRLLVRARDAGGLISVYEEGAEQEIANSAHQAKIAGTQTAARNAPPRAEAINGGAPGGGAASRAGTQSNTGATSAEDIEWQWQQLLLASGELIKTVEHALVSSGANFASVFRQSRLELADDYPFLDPANFDYQPDGTVQFRHAKPDMNAYVIGVSECLRHTVEKTTTQMRARNVNVRELVAHELAVLARRRQSVLARFRFTTQLERIAGTRIL